MIYEGSTSKTMEANFSYHFWTVRNYHLHMGCSLYFVNGLLYNIFKIYGLFALYYFIKKHRFFKKNII